MSIIPESAVGRQLAWYLERVASAGEHAAVTDGDRFARTKWGDPVCQLAVRFN